MCMIKILWRGRAGVGNKEKNSERGLKWDDRGDLNPIPPGLSRPL